MKNKIISIVTNIILIMVVAFSIGAGIYLGQDELSVYASAQTINGVIYAGNSESNKVSLMINVYWGTEFVEPMLDELDKFNAKCTFFIGGTWAQSNETLIKEIVKRGHELANHGFYHKEHANLDAAAQRNEINGTHNIIKNYTNVTMTLFAPPGGSYNKITVKVAADLGYKTIMWTRDTIDWRDKNEALIYNRAINEIKGGDLILMHPTECTLKALPNILKYIYQNNLVAATVSQTIA